MRSMREAVVVAALAAMPAAAETVSLTMASSHPTVFPWVGALQTVVVAQANERLEAMGSEHRIEWTESYGGALYGHEDTLEGVADGLADLGWVGTIWEESKMPLQNLTYYTPFTISDVSTLASIMDRLTEEQPAMGEAWKRQNLVYLGGSTADTYQLFTAFPVETLSDLEGRKILAPGPAAAFFPPVGATPVNGSLPTYYNQIATGVADGGLTLVTGYVPNKMYEVAPYVTLVDLGASYTGGLAANADVWDGLPEDVRTVLTELGQEYSDAVAAGVEANYERFLAELEANAAVTISRLDEAERRKWIDALPDLAAEWSGSADGAAEVLDAYMAAVRAAGVEPGRAWGE